MNDGSLAGTESDDGEPSKGGGEAIKGGPASRVHAATGSALVVLLTPELAGNAEEIAAASARLDAQGGARVLLLARKAADLEVGRTVQTAGLEVQVLAAAGLTPPGYAARAVAMPEGSTPAELDELALALSDAVLVAEGASDTAFARLARAKGKPFVNGIVPLPAPPGAGPLQSCLDPKGKIGRRLGWLAGRLEQFALELLTLQRQGNPPTFEKSLAKLRRAVRGHWEPLPYFAPEGNGGNWRELVPDREAVADTAPIVAVFNRIDPSATFGASLHRDAIWLTHLFAALAVFAAVAGAIGLIAGEAGWAFIELLLLGVIGAVVWAVIHYRLQDRWTASRYAAEQLRIARLCLPLLVVPTALAQTDILTGENGAATDDGGPKGVAGAKESTGAGEAAGRRAALAQARRLRAIEEAALAAKRAVRDQGLPRFEAGSVTVAASRAWLELIVDDQAAYHRKNYEKLEFAEHRLHRAVTAVFAATVLAVLVHFIWPDASGLLLVTAAGPALAAALHGASTRLSLVHRAEESKAVESTLNTLGKDVRELAADLPAAALLVKVRQLAQRAAAAMSEENKRWYDLLRRIADGVPG